MEAKKTIAILGIRKGDQKAFLDKLADDNRLLIISENSSDSNKVSDYLLQIRSEEEVELIDCAKDGCWEADIILLWNPSQHQPSQLERLQSVAIQKIVVMITSETTKQFPHFPHSKIVIITLNPTTNLVSIKSESPEALTYIRQLIDKTGVFKIDKN